MQRIAIDPSQIHDREIALTPAQQHYLTRVIRLQTGAQFEVIDGSGKLYVAEIALDRSQPPGTTTARIVTIVASDIDLANPRLPPAITLICALPKGNNFDDIVRACTELGVTTILPAISDRTLLDPSPQKLQRWRKIAQEAAEQSERRTIPTIGEPQSLQSIFSQIQTDSTKYLCEARGDRPHLLQCLQTQTSTHSQIIIAIGPEGGWTPSEIDRAIACDFQLVSLGRQILRTITAPIVALSLITAAIDANTRPQVLI
ncbi:16S rRNA (uracil(1498)-N(3))-methyltransferase [Chamaesiphon sp. VAR_69_metabat_338]|uniref:16S rRNA (uracil(1498)-N(3))-methyltransferase n=1 Tax=Chamaesiphon sp. VAR_69_metabat_338 TaxID=2964704 RepID=UPI00286E8ACA|nr:16S rRNA (uracil(1498)-N(3))-methyltransferase [Chamaesiphon sp. VAR_69_metabat_338]